MKRVHALLGEYGASHTHPTNEVIHWICVPVIYWTVIALIWEIPFPIAGQWLGLPWTWALVAVIAAQIYYFALSPKLATGVLLINIALFYFTAWLAQATAIPLWQIAIPTFIVAWIGQFIGHHIEKKRPSFLKDLQFLLIGPVWLLSHVYRRLGIAV